LQRIRLLRPDRTSLSWEISSFCVAERLSNSSITYAIRHHLHFIATSQKSNQQRDNF